MLKESKNHYLPKIPIELGHLKHDDSSTMFFPVIEAGLKQQANDIVDSCRSMLRGKFIRCDYKELAELTVLYLTGDLQDGISNLRD